MKKIITTVLLILTVISTVCFGQATGKRINNKSSNYTISLDSINAGYTKYNLYQTTAGITFSVANQISGSKEIRIRNMGSVKVLISPGDTLYVGKMAIMEWCGASYATTIVNASSGGGGGSFSTITGQPTDNANLATALNAKVNLAGDTMSNNLAFPNDKGITWLSGNSLLTGSGGYSIWTLNDGIEVDATGDINLNAGGIINLNGNVNIDPSGTMQFLPLTASRALALNSSKEVVSSTTTDTELGYVHGVTSDIQTQLNSKAATSDSSLTLKKANNLADLANKSTARTNLGVAIGINVQAYAANLSKWSLLDTTFASSTANGRLLKADWITFNSKQAGSANLTKWSLLDTVYATATRPGRLSLTDWNTFNNKGSGTVTSVGMTGDNVIYNTSVTGSPVTTSGSLVPGLKTQTATYSLRGPVSGSATAPTFRADDRRDLNNIYTEIGTVFTERWTNLSSWTSVGTPTATVTAGQLSMAGTIGMGNYIKCTGYGLFNYERAVFTDSIVVGTIGSTTTTYGYPIGIQSGSAFNNSSIAVNISLSTTNRGKIIWYTNGTIGTAAAGTISACSLVVTAGDVLTRKFIIEKNRYVFYVRNNTTGREMTHAVPLDLGSDAAFSSPYANAGYFAYYYLGGSDHKVNDFSVNVKHLKYPKLLFVGDSRERSAVNDANERLVDQLNKSYYGLFEVYAQSGNCAQDNNITEITNYSGDIIILTIGFNNVFNESAGTAFTNYQTLVSSLVGQGYVVGTNLFLGLIEPGSVNVNTFNTSILSTYGASACIDFYTNSWTGSSTTMNTEFTSDGIHSGSFMANIKTDQLANKFNLVHRENALSGQVTVTKNRNGYCGVGKYDINPYAALHAVNNDGSSQIIISGLRTTPTYGGSFASSVASQLAMTGGAWWDGSNYQATSTTVSGINLQSGEINFLARAASVGSTVSTFLMTKMDINGRWYFGSSTSQATSAGTAKIHIGAGTATASTAPQKFTVGSLLTVAEKGAVEYGLNGRFFFTPLTVRKSFVLSDTVVVTNGMLPIGNTSTGIFNSAVMTGSNGVTVTNGAGTIALSATTTIPGTTGNDVAVAGNIGERISSTTATYTNYTTTATYQAVDSITLTAGDWDISAAFTFSANSATLTAGSDAIFLISTVKASASGAGEGNNIAYVSQAGLLGTSKQSGVISPDQVNLSSPTKYYLNSQATFTIGNPQYVGKIRARRMR